jgi:RND family efflux transporter MFP subunit
MRAISVDRVLPIFAILSLSACALVACHEKPKSSPLPPTVTVAQPVQRSVTDYLELTGNTQAIRTVQLVARVAGYLDKVLFQDGQLVKKDQLLFLIQQNTYQDNLQQAEAAILLQKAQLEYAETELARYSNLLNQRAASQTDVDNWRYQRDSARANLLAAEAKRDLAKLDLAYTEVRAPLDGRIDRRLVDPGNMVGSGQVTTLAQLNQIDPMYVYFNISDVDLSRLMKEAQWNPAQANDKTWPVHLGLANEKTYPFQGRLDFASISLASSTGTLLLRAIFSNPDGRILPGLYARVRVPIKKKVVFMVPQEAVGDDQAGSYVLAVSEDNVVQRIAVKTGTLADDMRVVEEGLTGREWVVVNGVQKAFPGRKVTPEKQGPREKAKP